ncbi:hypothetical protein CPLU01_03162 [Colletotrichum plurivorum]|uniref:Uncharacterized protein n=1 Tax=Colletotrichum plurivorum TaxID=2175906 RepID=A0A8H6KU11_9PEZI|nr:hypothetical protein CPLU01_03162 [Colletotrichum plurivorum]
MVLLRLSAPKSTSAEGVTPARLRLGNDLASHAHSPSPLARQASLVRSGWSNPPWAGPVQLERWVPSIDDDDGLVVCIATVH